MKLALLHGRHDPEQDMDAFGFHGPVLEGVTSLKCVYLGVIRVRFKTPEAAEIAQSLTGWENWCGESDHLEMRLHQDMVVANGAYYGDWVLNEEGSP